MPRPLPSARLALTLTAAALLAPASAAFAADPVNQAGWSVTSQELSSGINLGYETAIDPVHRRLYAADAQPATRERRPVLDVDGNPTAETTVETTVPASGKIVSFDTATNAFLKNWSFLNLTGSDGIVGGGFSVWGTPNATTGISTSNNRATSNQPYGVAIDHSTADPTIVTVQTRTSSVAIFRASGAAPTDADVLPAATTGFFRARTPVVDSTRHKAYVVNYNSESGNVAVIDLPTKTVETTIPAPGAVGLALDEANNLLYAGTYTTTDEEFVRVIDLDTRTVVANIPGVGLNARPGFDPVGKKLYTANSSDGTVSVIDLDPGSASDRTVIKTITATGRPNAIAVDPARRLVYSADLGARLVSVIDADTNEFVQGVPTAGNAIDVDVDPVSGVAYASSQSGGKITAFKVQRAADLPQGAPGAPGTPGAPGVNGAPGPAGARGPAGNVSLSLRLGKVRVVGSRASVRVPAAGTVKAVVKAGKRTIATGTRRATKAGTVRVTLRKTKAGKALLRRRAVSARLTVTFTPKGAAASRTQKTVTARLARTRG